MKGSHVTDKVTPREKAIEATGDDKQSPELHLLASRRPGKLRCRSSRDGEVNRVGRRPEMETRERGRQGDEVEPKKQGRRKGDRYRAENPNIPKNVFQKGKETKSITV